MADLKAPPPAVIAAAAVVAGLVWAAHRAGMLRTFPQGALTELEAPAQNFAEHLAHASELLTAPVFLPHRYPDRTAPGTTRTMHQGFAPLYRLPDPQIAALPAEEPW